MPSSFGFVPVIPISSRTLIKRFSVNSPKCELSPSTASSDDLLIVGAGDLGLLVGHHWRVRHPTANVIGETRGINNHERLIVAGIQPRTYSTHDDNQAKAPNVVFCVPPPKIIDYYDILKHSLNKVRDEEGDVKKFLFISSTAVYPRDIVYMDEHTDCSTVETERGQLLYDCEQLVLQSGYGMVLRFSGLYSLLRGGHAFWVANNIKRASERKTANMLHRDDASKAVIAVLMNGQIGQTYLACSKHAVNARQISEAAGLHPEFERRELPTVFSDTFEERLCNSDWTREQVQWAPKWDSFIDFMKEDAERMRKGIPLDRLIA